MSEYLAAAHDALARIEAQDDAAFAGSLSRQAVIDSARRVLAKLPQDIGQVHQDSATLFSYGTVGPHQLPAGHALAKMFVRWRKDPPSVTSMVVVAAAHFGVPVTLPALQAALMIGLAADVDSANAYHSNHHFREVVAMMARLVEANNRLAQQGAAGVPLLNHEDIAVCLCAAAAHDLLHDGLGNAPNGNWSQYRLESASVDAAMPFLRMAGVTPGDIERVRAMILVTDTSAPAGMDSPHKILRKVFRGDAAVKVPPELAPLANDSRLLMMAALMSDADLSPSGATNYLFCRMQTHLFAQENPDFAPTDKNIGGFLSFVLENKFLSPAALEASQPSLTMMVKKVNDRIGGQKGADQRLRGNSPK